MPHKTPPGERQRSSLRQAALNSLKEKVNPPEQQTIVGALEASLTSKQGTTSKKKRKTASGKAKDVEQEGLNGIVILQMMYRTNKLILM